MSTVKNLWVENSTIEPYTPSTEGYMQYLFTSFSLSQTLYSVEGGITLGPNNVVVGDWFVEYVSGRSLKITEILEQTPIKLKAVLTDIDNFEKNHDPDGFSLLLQGANSGVIFSLNKDNIPVFNGLGTSISTALKLNPGFIANVLPKFQFLYPIKDTITLFSNKPVEISSLISYYNLGIFSPSSDFSGKVFILPDILVLPTLTPPASFTLKCVDSVGAPIFSATFDSSASRLLKSTTSSIEFKLGKTYIFSVEPSGSNDSLPVGLTAYITAYAVKS